MVRIQGAKEI